MHIIKLCNDATYAPEGFEVNDRIFIRSARGKTGVVLKMCDLIAVSKVIGRHDELRKILKCFTNLFAMEMVSGSIWKVLIT